MLGSGEGGVVGKFKLWPRKRPQAAPPLPPQPSGGSEINARPPGSRGKGREGRPCRGRTPGRAGRLQAVTQRLGLPHPLGRTPPLPMLVLLRALVGLQEQG